MADTAAPSAVASGQADSSTPAPTTNERLTAPATRRVVRTLTALGLTPEEAANLTAFMCGLPVEGVHWSLRQINELLFLRELQRTGRFGRKDGRPPQPH